MRTLTRWTCLILLAGSSWGWCQDPGIDAGDNEDERIQKIVAERKRREEELSREPTSLDAGATVNPLILDPVLDHGFGLRYEERDAYFRILELAWKTPLSEQQSFASDFRELRRLGNPRHAKRKSELFPVVPDIVNHPDEYRGHPVTLRGTMRKLTKFDPGNNSRGIQDLYEGWVYTDDSHATTPDKKEVIIPTVVIFQGKPDGLQVGGDLSEEVRVTGYFFKMYGYDSQDRAWQAPLILAGIVEWKKHEAYKPQDLGLEVYVLITLVVLVLGFVMWMGNRRQMTSAIHPAEADFSKFPPVEPPIKDNASRIGSKLTEPHDS